MGTISTGIGLISGINSKDIIDQLMSLEARPKDLLQKRIESTTERRLAYTDISTRLASIRLTGSVLNKPTTFRATSAASSNADVLTASTTNGSATGSFTFRVARLVTSQQTVSRGFADANKATVAAGTLTFELGGGEVTTSNALSDLRGGEGVSRGKFRITDRAGKVGVVDISSAVTLDDVVNQINTSLDVSVRASLVGDSLRITDTSGQSASNLVIQDIGDGRVAADLGLVTSVAASTYTGIDINYLSRRTVLDNLNDGRGIRTADGVDDLRITARDGSQFDINLDGLRDLGAVIDAVNAAGAGKIVASVQAGSNGLRIVDTSGGGGTLTVAALNSSQAAADLGIAGSAAGATLDGRNILASLGTVLLSSLRGGAGAAPGQISIQDRAGGTASINLTNASTVQDVIDAINNAAGIDVTASINDAGNGLRITDDTGGTGPLIIDDLFGGTLAENLGIKTAATNAAPSKAGISSASGSATPRCSPATTAAAACGSEPSASPTAPGKRSTSTSRPPTSPASAMWSSSSMPGLPA